MIVLVCSSTGKGARESGAGGYKSPCKKRDKPVCKGPETCKHTTHSGSSEVIGGFGGTEWMEGIIAVDDDRTAQWKDLWWSLGAAEGETPVKMGTGPLLAQKVAEMGKGLDSKGISPVESTGVGGT